MTRLITVVLSSVMLAFSSLVFAGGDDQSQAQTEGQTEGMQSDTMQTKAFSEVDADSSGTLDESEAQVADIQDFQSADENQDGELDRNEYYSAVTEQQAS